MPSVFNARGAGDRLGVTSQRARQLFEQGILPTTALLNGKVPLVDEKALLEVARQRAERKRRAA
jgi:predicted site-specific integrase-resolvase